MLAFDRLWSYIPQSYVCWTDITGLQILQETGEMSEMCVLEEGAKQKIKGGGQLLSFFANLATVLHSETGNIPHIS